MGFEDTVTLATCNLNQWALDFDGNLERIRQSIREAKAAGAKYRVGPELEITGYGCEDHFLETDTFEHANESLAALLSEEEGLTRGIVCDIGMPVLHGGVRYNCRVWCLDGRILLIRPKLAMADDGNYRETRYFTTWPSGDGGDGGVVAHLLPAALRRATGQSEVPFGAGSLRFDDSSMASETCEELFTPRSPHIALSLAGVEIMSNGSGSHHQLRKLDTRLELIRGATAKCGGVYLYANQQGCDGGRLYYDGCALIALNGEIVAQGTQFSVLDVEVVTATVDLADVRSFRGAVSSRSEQAAQYAGGGGGGGGAAGARVVRVPFSLCTPHARPTPPMSRELRLHTGPEEIAMGPACWLWDYLRRSGASGFFLPLSGGADSSSVAAIVSAMCHMVVEALAGERAAAAAAAGDQGGGGAAAGGGGGGGGGGGRVEQDVRRVLGIGPDDELPAPPPLPETAAQGGGAAVGGAAAPSPSVVRVAIGPNGFDARALAASVLHTAYMGTVNSGAATRSRARRLAEQIGAHHLDFDIDAVVDALSGTFARVTGKVPRFQSQGGTLAEDLALQNIQARLRMVSAYLLAQLLPWTRAKQGFLLVLGSANVDEALRGYMTKYDCSSADLNPIGSVSKGDLKLLLRHCASTLGLPALSEIEAAPPTAELRPLAEGAEAANGGEHTQLDEDDMGMTYEELGVFGRLRKIGRCGPVSMFTKLCQSADAAWAALSPTAVAEKVKRFFRFYAMNRHKLCTLTPAYHAEEYSPDDNRFDLRQFLYNVRWPRQFSSIDRLAEDLETRREAAAHKDPRHRL